MKKIFIPLFIVINAVCYGQGDSALQEKYFKYSQQNKNTYLLEYRFAWADAFDAKIEAPMHFHVPASITITWFYGNNKSILGIVNGVFSSTKCEPPDSADDQERWVTQVIKNHKR